MTTPTPTPETPSTCPICGRSDPGAHIEGDTWRTGKAAPATALPETCECGHYEVEHVQGKCVSCFCKLYLRRLQADKTQGELADLRAKVKRRTCQVYSEPCPEHRFIHGAEAEELREGIEKLTRTPGEVPVWTLQRLLDEVDARDSLAYVEARKRAELATDQATDGEGKA